MSQSTVQKEKNKSSAQAAGIYFNKKKYSNTNRDGEILKKLNITFDDVCPFFVK